MAIVRLQHVGVAVKDLKEIARRLEDLFGMKARDFRNDQGKGFQRDSRVLLGNGCWLHLVHNWNPESRVGRFLEQKGEGLEHIALESDDIENDVARLRDLGVPIVEDRIFDANDGFEAFVTPEDAIGFTVELIAPHAASWGYPDAARGERVSDRLGVTRIRDVAAVVPDVSAARERFTRIFDLASEGSRVLLGENAGLQLKGGKSGGLESAVLETESLDRDLERLGEARARLAEGGLPFEMALVGPGA